MTERFYATKSELGAKTPNVGCALILTSGSLGIYLEDGCPASLIEFLEIAVKVKLGNTLPAVADNALRAKVLLTCIHELNRLVDCGWLWRNPMDPTSWWFQDTKATFEPVVASAEFLTTGSLQPGEHTVILGREHPLKWKAEHQMIPQPSFRTVVRRLRDYKQGRDVLHDDEAAVIVGSFDLLYEALQALEVDNDHTEAGMLKALDIMRRVL